MKTEAEARQTLAACRATVARLSNGERRLRCIFSDGEYTTLCCPEECSTDATLSWILGVPDRNGNPAMELLQDRIARNKKVV